MIVGRRSVSNSGDRRNERPMHVQLIFTGGTISMEVDPVIGAAVPVKSGEQILTSAPGLDRIASFDINNFARLPGPRAENSAGGCAKARSEARPVAYFERTRPARAA